MAFTSKKQGPTSVTNHKMSRKEQLLQVRAMQTENDNVGCIRMSLLDVKSLLPEAKDRIEEKAILHDKY
jgi:hypothetical protein